MSKIPTLEEIGLIAVQCKAKADAIEPWTQDTKRIVLEDFAWSPLRDAIDSYNSGLGNKTANEKMADEFER